MGTALTTFADRPALSTKFATFFQENKNIQERETTPSLSYEGKQWAISINGERTVVQKKDADGDMVPVTTMKVVILDQNPVRGRSYYEGAYDPSKATMPKCWSDDCQTPSPHVKEPPMVDGKCVKSCAICPMSAKGSKPSTRNADGVACSQHQFIAVVPAGDMTFQPLRLKLAITSIWDGKNPANDEAGWFAFKNYTDFLRAHQVDHTALLVTKMKFDSSAEYPKVLFARDKFLTDEQLEQLIPVIQSDGVKKLISGSWTPNGVDGTKTAQLSGPSDDKAAASAKDVTPKGPTSEEIAAAAVDAERLAKAEAKKKRIAEAQAALAAAAAEDDDDAPAKPAVATKAAAVVQEDDEDEGTVVLPGTAAAAPTQAAGGAKAGAPKGKATPAAPAAAGKAATGPAAAAPEGLGALLSKWGD